MKCYHPLTAFRIDGKIVFNSPFPYAKGFNLPCGQCVGCRLNYSRQWATRIMHEAQMHDKSCFITLTFNPESLNNREVPTSLDVREFQRFMKRLRKKHGKHIRFFHCGEYGDKNQRPHYHAIIFGYDFPDKTLHTERNGYKIYESKELQTLWPYGFNTIGNCELESASYVARYVMKKQKGTEEQTKIDPLTGEVTQNKHEYCTMSRKPGIGYDWFKKYISDVFPHDYVVIKEKKTTVPRYYFELLNNPLHKETYNPELYEKIKQARKQKQKDKPVYDGYDENLDRLWVEEEVKLQSLKQLIRDL